MTIEVNKRFAEANTALVTPKGAILYTPPLDENYYIARVVLHADQAVVIFPKFGTIGCGFAQEEDWNTNLPITCNTEEIYDHIKHNRKYRREIKPADVKQAINMLREWCFENTLVTP